MFTMRQIRIHLGIILIWKLVVIVNGQEGDAVQNPYCFHFTWLGPKYDSQSNYQNLTCEDVIGQAKVPCVYPLVVTNNTYLPDTAWMWETYKSKPTSVGCRLAHGDVCVRYTYTYNQIVENITYLCSKVYIENERSVTSGCYKEVQHNGRTIEVCVCESSSNSFPCNGSWRLNGATVTFIVILIVMLMLTEKIRQLNINDFR